MKKVGRYQMLSRLGQGAMANVYRAHDPDIKRDLAIKILNQQYRRDPESVARFLREARAAGALSHPSIVTIYDVGEVDGFPYIAMELLGGKPLDKAVEERGAFPIETALHIGNQLADALRYAHELGIVHRDIKPSNIILGADGRTIKLLDFGIARVAAGGPDGANETVVKTQVGQVLGTPRYMSPEQALGHELDGRSDLFSVGAILYELVTGEPAFNGASIATLALQITTQQPAPIAVIPECPRGLRFIIDKLLSKRPEKRFANGAQLVAALNREASAWAAESKEEKSRRLPLHLRFALIASGIAACVLSVSMTWVLDQQYRAMERVAIASGSSISSFVASNAALAAMENAAKPAEEGDWLPVQAFVNTATADKNIVDMVVVDSRGVIRAAADHAAVGQRYAQPYGQKLIDPTRSISLDQFQTSNGTAFRFVTPIVYSGKAVGTVQVGIRKADLLAAAGWTSTLLLGLGGLMMAFTLGLGFFAGRAVLSPLRRLNGALKEAAQGRYDFRISHRRRDEFGELFDSFNALVEKVEADPDGHATTGVSAGQDQRRGRDQLADEQVALLRAAAEASADIPVAEAPDPQLDATRYQPAARTERTA